MKVRSRYGLGLAGVIAVLALIMISGCSDEAKDDAAKLEQELMDQGVESAVGDTAQAETTPQDETPMNAQAVPREEPDISGPSGAGYALQVASCESSDYARYLVDKYVGRGYLVYLTTFDQNGQTFFRVRLGPYETREEAENLKLEIKDKYSVDAWIAVE